MTAIRKHGVRQGQHSYTTHSCPAARRHCSGTFFCGASLLPIHQEKARWQPQQHRSRLACHRKHTAWKRIRPHAPCWTNAKVSTKKSSSFTITSYYHPSIDHPIAVDHCDCPLCLTLIPRLPPIDRVIIRRTIISNHDHHESLCPTKHHYIHYHAIANRVAYVWLQCDSTMRCAGLF